ncbi:MAG: hypothetical protein Kow0069_21610 [Promethearchaeota archaeon]
MASSDASQVPDLIRAVSDIDQKLRAGELVPLRSLEVLTRYTKILNVPIGGDDSKKFAHWGVIPVEWEDPTSEKVVPVNDLNLEIARVLFLGGWAHELAAEREENGGDLDEAVRLYSQAGRYFKTAALFSRVIIQEEHDLACLDPDALEFRSESLRAVAQSVLVSKSEDEGDLESAAGLSLGLSWMNRRLSYLSTGDDIKRAHFAGLVHFDRAMACSRFARVKSKRAKKDSPRHATNAARLLERAIAAWEKDRKALTKTKDVDVTLLEEDLEVARDELSRLDATSEPYDPDAFAQISPLTPVPENSILFFPKALGGLAVVYEPTKKMKREHAPRRFKFDRISRDFLFAEQRSLEKTVEELKALLGKGLLSPAEFAELSRKFFTELHQIEVIIDALLRKKS